jgi:hypothetical protein
MGNYNFKKDLAKANKTEKEIAVFLEKNSDTQVIEFNNDYRYDLKIINPKGEVKTIEIKEDFYCKKSGNIAVEYYGKNKLSGISVSEADIWIYKVHLKDKIELLFIKPIDLKKIINEKKYFKDLKNVGDGNASCYLFKYNVLKNISRVIKWEENQDD